MDVLDELDSCLVMTVHPGFAAQTLIPSCLDKVRQLAHVRALRGLVRALIGVEGGVHEDTVVAVMATGSAAFAEGMNILRHANAGKVQRDRDAETAPLEHRELYQYDFDLSAIAEVWRRGSVVASWLLDLLAASLVRSPDLTEFAGRVADSGEGRWTMKAAIDEGVPAPILSTAISERFTSRGEADFADRLLAALGFQFGGHEEKQT